MLAATAACAQAYPTKPIRFLVPYAAGAGTDTTARTLAIKPSERWGQQIIVDNRSGASGALAVETAVNANPDGCTIIPITNLQTVGAASGLKLPYQLERASSPSRWCCRCSTLPNSSSGTASPRRARSAPPW